MKKIVSLLSVVAIMATMAFSASAATEPTLSLEVSSTGLKAGDTVTVVCKYDGFDVTPYNDDEGAGQKITGAQVRINIPGGIDTATVGQMFLRPGITNVSGFATGAPQWNWDKNAEQFTAVIGNIDDPMSADGTVFTISMKLNKDVTEDLVFDFANGFEQTIVYDNYTDWEMGDTVQIKNAKLVSATLKAPAVEPAGPVIDELIDGGDMYGMKTKIAGVSIPETVSASKAVVSLNGEAKEYDLPEGVKGASNFIAIIRYAADLVNPAFTLEIK